MDGFRLESRLKSVGRPAHTRLTSDGRADRICEISREKTQFQEM